MNRKNNRPAYDRRLGNIRVAIFENESDGRVFFNASFTRRYKEGEEWKDSSTFNGLHDLAVLKELIGRAADYIASREEATE